MPKTAHLAPHQWTKGVSGNPAGRQKGSRAKLAELAVQLLHDDFVEHGAETIARVREKQPAVYLASVVALLPKQAQKIESPLVDLTDDELAQVTELLAAIRAKTITQIEQSTPPRQRHWFGGSAVEREQQRQQAQAEANSAGLDSPGVSVEERAPELLKDRASDALKDTAK